MNQKGSIILSLILFLVVSVFIMGILECMNLHLKIFQARRMQNQRNTIFLQAQITAVHRFFALLSTIPFSPLSSTSLDISSPENDSTLVPNKDLLVEKQIYWEPIDSSCTLVRDRIVLNIATSFSRFSHSTFAMATAEWWRGQIPVTDIPVFINKNLPKESTNSLGSSGVQVLGGETGILQKVPVNFDMEGYLRRIFHIGNSPWNWMTLRKTLGLPIADIPIPDGIYPVNSSEGVLLFVQGNLEQIVFHTSQGFQEITIVSPAQSRRYRYIPGEYVIDSTEEGLFSGRRFSEKIVVNGSIFALRQEGIWAFLNTTHLEILAGGNIHVRDCLQSEPYRLEQKKSTPLTLISGKEDLVNKEFRDADIILSIPGTCAMALTLIAEGNLVHKASSIRIHGSIYAEGIENSGKIEIVPEGNEFSGNDLFRTQEGQYAKNFQVLYLMDVNDE